jgi:hypothetical protein
MLALHMSRLPISTKLMPCPNPLNDAATIPQEVREFSTTPPSYAQSLCEMLIATLSQNAVLRELVACDAMSNDLTTARFLGDPAVP